jgi:hypothetical protein
MATQFFSKVAAFARRSRLGMASALGAAILCLSATHADAGNMLLQIQQGAAEFNTSGTPNFVGVSGITVGDYLVTFSGGSSNTPGTGFNAILNSINLTVTRLTDTSGAPLLIRLLSNDYTLPEGNPLYLGSSAAATYTGLADDSSISFTSFFSASNSTTFGDGVATSPVIGTASDTITDGEGNRAPTIIVNRPNPAFALSNLTSINLLTVGSTVNTAGSTEVRANPFGPGVVPEPASMVLLAVGGLGLVGFGYRRRNRTSKND